MVTEVPTETLIITLSEADKRKLRVAAALRGVSMRQIVREWIQTMPPEPREVANAGSD